MSLYSQKLKKWHVRRTTTIGIVSVTILALVLAALPFLRAHATIETFTTAGSNTWTAPAGVTSVQIECWGAGGGSGAGDQNNSGGGGGGGGGAYAIVDSFPVSPGNSYDYTVGAGGSGTAGDGGNGGNSTFNNTTCVAEGGSGGLSAGNGGTGGTAGAAGNSTGDTTFSGGAGANGGGTDGGGGGSSAGTAATGADGVGTTGGTAPSGGGDGGDGGVGDGSAANPGFAPGGAAGGAGDRQGQGQDGAAGADGQIRLTYTADTQAPTPDPMYFDTPPTATTTDTIRMVATTASDATSTPVEYQFTATSTGCSAGHFGAGDTQSAWQTSTIYNDTGLSPNRCYGYVVQARDQAENYTASSTASSTYTHAAVPGGMGYSNVDVTAITLQNDENGNPTATPDTDFAVYATSTDSRWHNVYVTAAGGTTTARTWLKDSQIDGLTLSGLITETRYDFEVVARNEDAVVTASSTLTGTTTLADTFAPTPDPATFATDPDDTGISSVDMTATTGSDDTPPIEYYFAFDNATCGVDAGTGGTDSGWQGSTGYTDSGLDTNQCYGYTVTMRDSLGNYTGTSSASRAYTAAAVPGAPTLGNVTDTTLDITNNENGNPATTTFAVYVVSSTPSDATWEGKYVDGSGDPSATPVWMTDATITNLTVTGLAFETTYAFEVVARNGDDEVTASSTESEETTSADQTAPTPDPPFFVADGTPQNDSASAISATSTTLSDPTTPVEYYFTAVAGSCGADLGAGGTDSGWQSDDRTYTDTGLEANQCYGYQITGRDAGGNYTATSTASSTYTSANTPGTLTSALSGETTLDLQNAANGNPASNPTTEFAVYVTGSTPSDATWNNRYVDGSGDPSVSAVWLSDASIDSLAMRGLTASTTYDFEVVARNADGDVTASSTASIATSVEIIEKTRLHGVRLNGMRLNGW